MSSITAIKSVALSIRGFDLAPKKVESIIGVAASELGMRGEPVRPGVKALLKRSFVRFSVSFPDGCRLDEMIPALLIYLGGINHIRECRDKIKPEFLEIDMILPVKNSNEQEGGFIAPSTLAELSQLGASLSFQFL
ncbi:hypothetical protein [Pseudomonas cerasi]|uniref:ISYps3 transposase n=1 Tax=Pseudomonas cerasi TaxID=1583341 RepID=A0A193SIA4_9PSED|nr:hypothetical protein [Pseudomonas cerasi]CZT25942.1 hypothetical protein PCPL58_p1035 [Pseudomonas cerasi]SOS30297.1 hypothetical protein PL963_P300019 [Pseudomonas cerasi]